ncbi:hypothetical protein CEXT_245991 [Caerostris extrusa]|uniref:Uncharacterized protein n=1 Tax=Caerostris extrusa TaxID=172846 RepID=A0AAV4NRZ9_CAEEX|nr:hypothetical protein CEXT_245991 [Caerostris extrusa]
MFTFPSKDTLECFILLPETSLIAPLHLIPLRKRGNLSDRPGAFFCLCFKRLDPLGKLDTLGCLRNESFKIFFWGEGAIFLSFVLPFLRENVFVLAETYFV